MNYYEGKLNLKDILKKINLQNMDEALNICDLSTTVDKYSTWVSHMPKIKPYYAVKCNDDPLILRTLVKLGTNFDCASKDEIKKVLEEGVSPERIIFANPCKPVSHLNFAKENSITTSTVDNEYEIYKIFKVYQKSNVVVRIRSEAKEAQCPLGEKFGCDAADEATALILLANSLSINVAGVSFHVGSGCSDFPAYDRGITTAKHVFSFGLLSGIDMNVLDIGGGFPGNDDDKFISISNIINKSLEKNFGDTTVHVIAEPGRFFVAAAYTLICKIHAKREIRNADKLDINMYYINDGVYGSFNCILYDHQKVTAFHLLDENNLPKFKTLIWGPTCDALDKITDDVYLPNLSCGDLIAFPNMGAYTVPIASPFNGFMIPKTLYFLEVSKKNQCTHIL